MDENKKKDEKTEELPVVENVVWHQEEENDSLDEPVEKEVHMTPIEADTSKIPQQETVVAHKKPIVEKTVVQKKVIKKEKKDTKKVKIITAILIGVILLGGIGYYLFSYFQASSQAKKDAYDKVYSQLKVTFKEAEKDEDGNLVDPTIFEYGSEASDPMSLVDTYYGTVTCEPSKIDTSTVGSQTITYTTSMKDSYSQEVTRDFTLEITVHDTQSPIIEFNESSITMIEEEEFDSKENIKSITDVVDGELEYVEAEPEKENKNAPFYTKGWYTVTSDLDTDTPGSYTVRVKACDINGNSSELAYTVIVKQKDPTSFMTIGTRTITSIPSLSQKEESDDQAASETGDWNDLSNYLGDALYTSGQYTSQDEMMSEAKSYFESNFDELTKNKSAEPVTIIGSITIDSYKATLYYMEALDDAGNVMYYFFAIV